MDVRSNSVHLTVADYCNAYNRGDIFVDSRYQRNPDLWPASAQSYLIETILKGFPVPKLALHQKTDLKTRSSQKFIVDGQQRTRAIVDFFNGTLILSRSLDLEDAKGKAFSALSEDLQEQFLGYLLHFDQFEATGDEDVREYFRRINSFTAPLNPEERRNASFQGGMKWFILQLAEKHSESLVRLGTFTEKQVLRMADQKFLAELVHAMLEGVRTTNARMLDAMYRQYDEVSIPRRHEIQAAIGLAFEAIRHWPLVQRNSLTQRGHALYSLILALVATQTKWDTLEDLVELEKPMVIVADVEYNLTSLGNAMLSEEEMLDNKKLSVFRTAAKAMTNTKAQRETRIRSLAIALVDEDW